MFSHLSQPEIILLVQWRVAFHATSELIAQNDVEFYSTYSHFSSTCSDEHKLLNLKSFKITYCVSLA